jgi:KaiC/GvpD/RAD55 family RecA-like ATPase
MAKKRNKNKAQNKKTSEEKIKQAIERTKTGVEGFDELVEGGLPQGSFVLLSGGTGTGKSIFGMNFLTYGAQNGEPGVYVSLEEGYDENKMQMKIFGWNMESLQKEKKLLILQPKMYNFDKLVEAIQTAVYNVKAKRLVIDSISILELYFEDQFKTRRNILDLAKMLKGLGVTTIAISETDENTSRISRQGVEEFVSDGVILLYLDRKENLMNRAISVRKLRATNHSLKVHPVKIEKNKGMVIYPYEESFEEFK